MTTEYILKFQKLISEIKKSSFSKPFKRPPIETLHDKNLKLQYTEIIKKPMYLDLVSNKLKKNEYCNIKEFIDDIFLIFNNAMLFNRDGSRIYEFAKSLKIKAQLKFEEMKFLPESGVIRNLNLKRKKNKNEISGNDSFLNKKKKNRINYNFEQKNIKSSKSVSNTSFYNEKNLEFENKKYFNEKENNKQIEEIKKELNKKKKNQLRKEKRRKEIQKRKEKSNEMRNNKNEIKTENKGTNTIIISENQFLENNILHEKDKLIICKMINKLNDEEITNLLTYLTYSCNALSHMNEKMHDCIVIDFDKFNDDTYKNLIDYLKSIEEKKKLSMKNISEFTNLINPFE